MTAVVQCPYCGLSQDEPEGVKQCVRCGGSLVLQSPVSPLVFICYSRKNAEFVDQLTSDLNRLGVVTWRDVDNIASQRQANLEGWRAAIEDALTRCTEMLVILSPDSVTSQEVEAEWNDFASRKRPIFPILVSECRTPYFLRRYQVWDLRTDYERQVKQLAQLLLGKPGTSMRTDEAPQVSALNQTPKPPLSNRTVIPTTPGEHTGRYPPPTFTPAPPGERPAAGQAILSDLKIIGKEVWRFKLPGDVAVAPLVSPDGTIYVITHNGLLAAISAQGDLAWQAILGGANSFSGAVQPVMTCEKHILTVFNGQLMAFDAYGNLKWTQKQAGNLTCKPTVAPGGNIYVINNNSVLTGISKEGQSLWKTPLCQIMGGGTWPSPVVGADGSIYAVCKGREIYNLDADSGAIRWQFTTNDKMESSPAAHPDGLVFFCSSGGWVFAMNKMGRSAWQASVAGPPGYIQMVDAPVVLGADGLIYVTPRHGTIFAIDPKDGKINWSHSIGGQGVGINPVTVTPDGYVFARNLQGVLVGLSPEGKMLWQVKGSNRAPFSPPSCFGKDRLIVGIGPDLTTFQIKT